MKGTMAHNLISRWSGAVGICAIIAVIRPAHADPRAVVELFTSQGCNSCPPADSYLSDLTRKARRIGRGSRTCHLAAAGEFALAQHSRWPKPLFCLQQLPVDIDSRWRPDIASSPGR